VNVGADRLAFSGFDGLYRAHRLRFYRAYLRNSIAILRYALRLARNSNFDGIFVTGIFAVVLASLIGGIAAYLKSALPHVRVVGVAPAGKAARQNQVSNRRGP